MMIAKSSATKILASMALVAGAAGVAGLGTFGEFTSSTAATQQTNSGIIKLNMSSPAGGGLEVASAKMVPGDTIQRAIVLAQDGTSEEFSALTLVTDSTADSLLATNETDGLQLTVEQCSAPAVVNADKTVTCAGATTVLSGPIESLAERPLDQSVVAALNGASSAANLKITVTLPTSAGNEFQNLSDSFKFTFTAKQRVGKAV